MRKFVMWCAVAVLAALPLGATSLTGTFKHPDGSPVNGKLILLLSQPAKLSDNSAQIVPMVKIFAVTNGTLEAGAMTYGNDVLLPMGTFYVARLVDNSNNLLFEQRWSISGASLDLGSLTPTSTGVVVPDPLLRNVVTSQVVSGPVTFSSPITAFTLTLNGNFTPGAAHAYDLGNPTQLWRELFASKWDGEVHIGNLTATVTAPATAPTVATDATSGGSLDNTTLYIAVTLITLNGETTRSPVQSFTPSTCAGGTCKLSVNVAGNEWREGAFGFRVYACSDASGTSCYRQTGFPEELDTAGALANAHYAPGTVILSSISLSGTAPPSTNTASIDADQVALNATCNAASGYPRCYGRVQYRPNPQAGNPSHAQVGTTPLVVAWPAEIEGFAVSGLDDVESGSTRSCTFAHVKLGCVMVMNTTGVNIRSLHVQSASNGYLLTSWPSTFNQIEIANATVKTTGTLAVAPLRIRGIWYYLRFPNLQLTAGTTGTGVNKGAALLVSNAAGATWEFSGPVRWTVADNNDAIRNDKGKTDPDRGNSTNFPTFVGDFKIRNVQVQWGPTGSGQGQLIRGENLVLQLDGFTHSDYNPVAGAGPLIEIGGDADGAAACCTSLRIENSSYLAADADNASWVKLVSNSGGVVQSVVIRNVRPMGVIDMNSLSVAALRIEANDNQVCNPNSTGARIINMATTQALTCSYASNNGTQEKRVANFRVSGSLALTSDGSSANHRHLFWSGADDMTFTRGANPATTADFIWQSTGSKQFNFYDNAGTGTLFRVDARSGVNLVQVGANLLPITSAGASLGSSSLRFSSGFFASPVDVSIATGTAPFVITSTTEVANLNAQNWHGKQAVDFSSTLDFGSIAAQACAILTITATGAAANNPVAPSWPVALEAGLTGLMHITADNTVTVRLCNVTASAIDPAGQTFAGRIIQ